MNLVTLATYPTAHDAELHKVRLEQAGVKAYVDGGATADALSIGSFLGGVKLLVAETDVAKARGALSLDDKESATPAWTCSECGNEVEAGYEVCWSCGHTIDGDETFLEEPQLTGEPEPIACPMCGEPFTAPPYQCPSCGEKIREDEDEVELKDESLEELEPELTDEENEANKCLLLGWRSSIIGLMFVFFLPIPAFQIYSVGLLYRYMNYCDDHNATPNWRAWFGFLLNLLAIFVWMYYLSLKIISR